MCLVSLCGTCSCGSGILKFSREARWCENVMGFTPTFPWHGTGMKLEFVQKEAFALRAPEFTFITGPRDHPESRRAKIPRNVLTFFSP